MVYCNENLPLSYRYGIRSMHVMRECIKPIGVAFVLQKDSFFHVHGFFTQSNIAVTKIAQNLPKNCPKIPQKLPEIQDFEGFW